MPAAFESPDEKSRGSFRRTNKEDRSSCRHQSIGFAWHNRAESRKFLGHQSYMALCQACSKVLQANIARKRSILNPAFMAEINQLFALSAAVAATLAPAPSAFAKEWKTVVIGMEGAYDPYNLTNSSGHIVGFEVDLANDLCKRVGVECKIIAQDWDGMIPGLKAGKFDVIMDGMSIADDRKKEIDFSKPYAAPPAAFIAAKDGDITKALGAAKVVNADKDPKAGNGAIKAVQAALKGKTIHIIIDHPRQFRRQVPQGRRDGQRVQDHQRPRSRPQGRPHRRRAR